MKTRPRTTLPALASALLAAWAGLTVGGCAAPSAYSSGDVRGATFIATEPGYERTAYRRASSHEAVFDSSHVRRELAGVDPSYLPEYARRDADLSVTSGAPLLATSQWPQTPAPTLWDYRYVYLPPNASTQLFFDAASGPASAPYRWGWRERYYHRP